MADFDEQSDRAPVPPRPVVTQHLILGFDKPTLELFQSLLAALHRQEANQRRLEKKVGKIMATLDDVLTDINGLATSQQKSFDEVLALIGSLGKLSAADQAKVDQVAAIIAAERQKEADLQAQIEPHLPAPTE